MYCVCVVRVMNVVLSLWQKADKKYYNNWVALRATFPHVADDMPLFVNKKFHVPAQSYIYVVIENLLLSAGIP